MSNDRNEPCTCGSGIKFKKCCRDKPYQGPIRERKRSGSKKGLISFLTMAALATMETGDPCYIDSVHPKGDDDGK